MVPWLSRHREGGLMTLARGYEIGLKVMIAMLLPIGTAYLVIAAPLIHTLYGPEYADSVTSLRWLAGMTVLFGVNTFIGILAITRDHPGDFVRPAVIVIVQNLIFNLILIPRYGASGAAFNAVLSGAILALWTGRRAGRRIGHISLTRVLAAPLLASGAMAGTILLTGADIAVTPLVAGALVYVATFALIERLAFPADFRFYARAAGRRQP